MLRPSQGSPGWVEGPLAAGSRPTERPREGRGSTAPGPRPPVGIGFVETPVEIADLMVRLSTAPRSGAALDPGCGRGVFLDVLRRHGFSNVWGIEIDGDLYEESRARFGDVCRVVRGDFLSYDFGTAFDLIVGNPPYAHMSRLPAPLAESVRRIVGTGEGDIYYAFIIRAIQLLREGGELIFITPYHFFYNTHARRVREAILANGALEVVIDLDEARIFEGESPETVIFRFRKASRRPEGPRVEILLLKDRRARPPEIRAKALEALEAKSSNELFDYREAERFRDPGPWSTHVRVELPSRRRAPAARLGDVARVGVGLVSGFDRAFLLDPREVGDLGPEAVLVRRLVKARNCARFLVRGHAYYILVDDSVRSEEDLARLYPRVYRRLLPYKEEMAARYLPRGKMWFHWQALRNYGFLAENVWRRRIYVPSLDRSGRNRFSLGEGGLLPAGDVLFIQPERDEDVYYLLGVLNTRLFREGYLERGGRRGGRIAFTQRLLEGSEVPLLDDGERKEVERIVMKILARGGEAGDLEEELEDVVSSGARGL